MVISITFILNPISYRGEGTIEYNGCKYPLVSPHDELDLNCPFIFLETNNNGLFFNKIIISKDAKCFIINENYQGWRIVFSEENPTVEEVRSRVSELGFGLWFDLN